MIHFVVEPVFQSEDIEHAARAAGHVVQRWDDSDWAHPFEARGPVIFRGSLANADRWAKSSHTPGAYCDTRAFACSQWYPKWADVLAQKEVRFSTVRALCSHPPANLGDTFFVRPNSCLKPFSGRVVARDNLTPTALDHGFYFDDLDLPVVTAATRTLSTEVRHVVVDHRVVASSTYIATARQVGTGPVPVSARAFAQEVASRFPAPEVVYVLDTVHTEQGWAVLELNPFSGADLQGCDRSAIVHAIAELHA